MPKPRKRRIGRLLIAAALALAAAAVARADVLILTDGRTLVGEVVEESRWEVKFRCRVNRLWTTLNIDRGQIYSLDKEEGDQSDRGGSEAGSEGGTGTAAPPPTRRGEPAPKPAPKAEPKRGEPVVVIPLHGQVGGAVENVIRGTFDAQILAECLQEAEEAGARLVILDLQSPGGLVAEMEAICELIIEWHDRLRIVAYPNEAFSAAAIIALSCRELAVREDSLIGAAVIIKPGQQGWSAVEAKFASPHYARQRVYMGASGQPYEVVQAMTIQETELWWSVRDGFTTEQSQARGPDWERIDDLASILTLTGAEALKYDVAHFSAADLDELIPALGVDREYHVLRLDEEIVRYNLSLDRKFSKLREAIDNYFEGLIAIANGLGAYPDIARSGDRNAANRVRSMINRGRNRALSSARQIAKMDRSLLRRRVELPDVVLQRLEEDKALIGRISRLLETDSIDDFNEAVERINAVIEGWRELLGG